MDAVLRSISRACRPLSAAGQVSAVRRGEGRTFTGHTKISELPYEYCLIDLVILSCQRSFTRKAWNSLPQPRCACSVEPKEL